MRLTHHDIGLLEIFGPHRFSWSLIKKGSINNWDKGELGDTKDNAAPLCVDQLRGILGTKAINDLSELLAVVRALDNLCQPEASHHSLLLGNDPPWNNGTGTLHDGLAEEVA